MNCPSLVFWIYSGTDRITQTPYAPAPVAGDWPQPTVLFTFFHSPSQWLQFFYSECWATCDMIIAAYIVRNLGIYYKFLYMRKFY